MIGLAGLAAIGLSACFAPLLAPHDPNAADLASRLLPPGAAHLMGTDELGRDILSRTLFGARLSLSVGFGTTLLALAIGAPIGLISGYVGGWVDLMLMRFCDVFLAFPPLLLPMAITAALGFGLGNAMIGLGISWFPWYARIARGAVLSVISEPYILSARAIGLSDRRILLRHVLPNAWAPIFAQASLDVGYTILAAASLSFLGIGAQPPQIEWGLMTSASRLYVLDYWWTGVFPGLAIFGTVLVLNIAADGLRDMLDPLLRRAA